MRAYAESFPVTTDDASCFGCLLVQVPLISRRHSTRSAKLPLAVTVVVIVEFMCIQDYEERMEGAYAQDELNIWANVPSSLLSKSSVQKGGSYFWELTVVYIIHMCTKCFVLFSFRSHQWKILSWVSWLTEYMHCHLYNHILYFFLLSFQVYTQQLEQQPSQAKRRFEIQCIINRFSVLTTVEPCRRHSTADTYPENSESPDSYSVHFSI